MFMSVGLIIVFHIHKLKLKLLNFKVVKVKDRLSLGSSRNTIYMGKEWALLVLQSFVKLAAVLTKKIFPTKQARPQLIDRQYHPLRYYPGSGSDWLFCLSLFLYNCLKEDICPKDQP
jgi:hypothetical protein